jgi:catechol 2,3-dioxygenase-like lactoylglutathione lyase family enzyme
VSVPSRITVVTIGAHEMAVMRAFYRGLGWPETASSSDEFASFRTSGAILALFPFEELARDGRVPAGRRTAGFRGVTLAINVESKEAVDATAEDVRRAGGRITKEPEDAFWGGRSAYFADPEGNLWEIAWAPGSSFDDEGAFIWSE